MNNHSIKSQAKRAYEFARLKMATYYGLIVIPLIVLSCLTCGSDTFPLLVGGILLSIVIFFKWRGLDYGKAVVPGLIAGGVAFAIPLVMHVLEICCRNNLELFFCVASGLVGGAILGKLIANQKENRSKILGFGLIISGLTASLGCASLGIAAVSGLVLSLVISAIGSSRFYARK